MCTQLLVKSKKSPWTIFPPSDGQIKELVPGPSKWPISGNFFFLGNKVGNDSVLWVSQNKDYLHVGICLMLFLVKLKIQVGLDEFWRLHLQESLWSCCTILVLDINELLFLK